MSAIDTPAAGFDSAPASFRMALGRIAANWNAGHLTVALPDGRSFRLGEPGLGPDARIVVKDYGFIGRCLTRGDTGFAEGYMAGEWDTPDLAALLEVMALNFDRIKLVSEGGLAARIAGLAAHAFRRNSRKGARRNIEAHYDLGNDFYAAWLDPGMTYSSAAYASADQTLEAAQRAKYAALARNVGLRSGDEVLEIGCGWGGFAEFAAREVGASVVGLTLSPAQRDYARQRIFEQGLADRVDIRLTDYRDVEGQYDHAISIEMFEAVGQAYWSGYFGKLAQVLKPGGRAGLQVITIEERLFSGYRNRADFIRSYIFPGGMLPSEERLEAVACTAGLAKVGVQRFGTDYARTLAEWGRRFDLAWPDIQAQGFDERFRRLWRFYLAYCEAGFRTRRTDVVQLILAA